MDFLDVLLSILIPIGVGFAGFLLARYWENSNSKNIKIHNVAFTMTKILRGGYFEPSISLQIENLSKTDLKLGAISIVTKKRGDHMDLVLEFSQNEPNLKRYEVKDFSLKIKKRTYTHTRDVTYYSIDKINTPKELFDIAFPYLNRYGKEQIKNEKEFKKAVSQLRLRIKTNINTVQVKLNKGRKRNSLYEILQLEYDKRFRS